MNWEELYNSKKVTAREAISKIHSNSRIVTGHAVAEPKILLDELVLNYKNFQNLEILHLVSLGKGDYAKKEMQGHIKHNALFVNANTRKAVQSGLADYTPTFFFEIPRLFKKDYLQIDVCMLQLSPPDKHGYCSYGTSCDYTKAASECAKLVIAEINPNMPRVLGDNFIHISNIDYIVEVDYPLPELKSKPINDVEKAIGENCAKLIENGSTLQLGIGSIPDAVLMFLHDKKDLGIHSEMVSDGIVDLFNEGIINNKQKSLHQNKIVLTFMMGTKKLYDFVNDNPVIEMHPVDYVNHPVVVSKNNKMVSINSCLQVDLFGQVNSESIDGKQFSGVGGQVDYVRGAGMSKDGKSIIAMPSTASKGAISRIVPKLDSGASVTTSRNDIHYIVTEYGIADLRGKTLKERAKALISIAHPKFRNELEDYFKNYFNL
ncbi:acetyl-CoA hydrolase/transferase C-terminal domain-containing protein [Clostridium perfringens]|nr:acetyl-CoA hydrolase/transferase C-terminal domain-containing protein [Clostridium perfringens]